MTATPARPPPGAAARWAALERALASRSGEDPDRCHLAQGLAQPLLLDDIDAVLERFHTGADPLPDDERWVSTLLRARALLDVLAPRPDPLGAALARLDARWEVRQDVAWVL